MITQKLESQQTLQHPKLHMGNIKHTQSSELVFIDTLKLEKPQGEAVTASEGEMMSQHCRLRVCEDSPHLSFIKANQRHTHLDAGSWFSHHSELKD